MRDWQIHFIGSLPLSKGFKYVLVYVDTVFGLTHTSPCHHTNQVVTIRG